MERGTVPALEGHAVKETVFHEDVFYAYFHPFRHPSSRFNIWGGLGLETFGEDLRLVHTLDASYLWTVVEGAVGADLWITPGLQHVNRICHLVTRLPHDDVPVAFRTEGKPRPITAIGLRRRMAVLKRLMTSER